MQVADQAQSVEEGAKEQIVSVGEDTKEQAQNGSVEQGVKDGTEVCVQGVYCLCTGCILHELMCEFVCRLQSRLSTRCRTKRCLKSRSRSRRRRRRSRCVCLECCVCVTWC